MANDLKLETVLTLKDKASKELKKFQKNIKGTGSELKSLGKSFASVFAGGVFLKSLFDVNSEFQKLSATVSVFTKDAQETDTAMKFLLDVTKQIPENLSDVTTAFIRMKGLGLAPTKEALLSFSNTAAATGKTIIQFVEAVADATTGEFERLKEFGIKASKQGDRVKFTFQGITTEIENSATAIDAYLQALGNNQFAGAAEKQMGTLAGQVSNLRVAWEELLVKLGEGGVNSTFSNMIGGITTVLNSVGQLRGVFIAFFAVVDTNITVISAAWTVFSLKMAKGFAIAVASIKNQFIDLGNSAKRIINLIGGAVGLDPIFLEKIPKAVAGIKSYEDAIKRVVAETKASVAAIDENATALIGAGIATKKSSEELEKYNDKLKAEAKSARAASVAERSRVKAIEAAAVVAKAAAAEQKKLDDRGESIRTNVRTAQEIFDETKAELEKLKLAGSITGETYDRALQSATKSLADFNASGKEELDDLTEFAREAARQIENGFADFFFDAMQGNFDNMGDSFKKTIDRMVANFLASKLAGFLFGDFGTSSGSLGGVVGQGVAAFQGFFADGGNVVANRPLMVGERGPELFVPNTSGTIVSNDTINNNSSGGGTINLTVNALDSKDVISKLEEIKRPLTEMINGTNQIYGLQNGATI